MGESLLCYDSGFVLHPGKCDGFSPGNGMSEIWRLKLVLFCCIGSALAGDDVNVDDSGRDFFERRIRPILVEYCFECHSTKGKSVKGGLRLDSASGALAGGDSGPVIVPGRPEASLLMDAVSYSGDFVEMPPSGKLPVRILRDFRQWIKIGAPFPEDRSPQTPRPRQTVDIEQGRKFWSFQPLNSSLPPAVGQSDWPKRRPDRFVLRRLEELGLRPAEAAGRRTLSRRLSLDLIGLPLTAAETERFVSDTTPDAYERLVDLLLSSPHYGERWGRHWLDVARYAEDNPTGESTCLPPPYPWPYRDWVIRALNDDMGYDEFVRRQLAADLMDELSPEQIAATGFLGLSPVYHKEPRLSAEVISVIVADEWDERLDTVTRGLLGLTVACARCHDHKFDPVRMQDYYGLAGVMASTRLVEWPLARTAISEAEAITETREAIVDFELRINYADMMQSAAAIEQRRREPYQNLIERWQKSIDVLKSRELFDGPVANVVRDAGVWVNGDDPDWTVMEYRPGESRDLPIFIRGNPHKHGEVISRRFIEVLSPGIPERFGEGSGRLELANAITNEARSLAARVIVNRVWGWHFGQPLVRTPSNFGALGDRPSHPELLDDLSGRFVSSGWSLKWLHREIVLSATYRQASIGHDEETGRRIDPDNRQLWKMNRLRLDPEVWRDNVLAVCDRLDSRMFGPSGNLDEWENRRRTVYGTVSRQKLPSVLQLFDFPDAKRHADRRILTTTPLQQLYLLNNSFLRQHAVVLAGIQSDNRAANVERLFQAVLLRRPTHNEYQRASALLDSTSSYRTGLQLLTHSLLASNEFLFMD